MKNIFIEGTQGSGKTTLLRLLSQKLPEYHMYWEGDISPVELAWCSYMTEAQYEQVLRDFPEQEAEIRRNTAVEKDHRIVSYTRILAENRVFYEYMERFEIYNGRISFEEFCTVIRKRFAVFRGEGNLFECSFFQNIIENLMLYFLLSEEEILDFYMKLFALVDTEKFLMIYLESEDMEANIWQIKKERTDQQGNEIWYDLMMRYLNDSPYGKEHPFAGVEDIAAHFRRRADLEKRILREVIGAQGMILPAKQFEVDDVVRKILMK